MQSPPSSVIFSLGGFDFHYYGLIMFISIVTALFVMKFIAKKYYKTIDTEVKGIIDDAYAKAKSMIIEHRGVLDSCAELLLEKEKITREEFEALFE